MRNRSAIHLCLIVGLVLLVVQLSLLAILLYPFASDDVFPIDDIAAIVNISTKLHSSLLVVDENILHNYVSNKQKVKYCLFCGVSYPVTFAIFFQGVKHSENLHSMFRSAGFQTALLLNIRPLEASPSLSVNVPLCLVLKRKVIIHIVIFHEREGNFWWHGSLLSDPSADNVLMSMGISTAKSQLMKQEGAFEKFEVDQIYVDGLKLLIPKDVTQFLKESANSHFIECSHKLANSFHRKYGKDTSHEALKFAHKAWKLLSRTKTILDKIGVRFWLSSGTCLGYFRQCDIISYSRDVDVGIFIKDYKENIVTEFINHGFTLKHWFGKVNDSLELSFMSGDLKLDMFFFYEEGNSMWNGGTQAKSGKKFKYIFPRFNLCWTEFLELKVRVPCDLTSYIEANYGPDWFTPVTHWDWKSSPPNVVENGMWPPEEWYQVIKVYN
ncbi:hypothetical protein R5R35_009576 [Gryllus longicercus]